jgi:hypothetical protein
VTLGAAISIGTLALLLGALSLRSRRLRRDTPPAATT